MSPDRAWAIAQAADVDLSGLTILHLHNLFRQFSGIADQWLDASCVGWAPHDRRSAFAEPDAAAEPSLAAAENHHDSQLGWCRGGDADREAETPEIALPEVAIVSPVPKLRPVPPEPLPWGGEATWSRRQAPCCWRSWWGREGGQARPRSWPYRRCAKFEGRQQK